MNDETLIVSNEQLESEHTEISDLTENYYEYETATVLNTDEEAVSDVDYSVTILEDDSLITAEVTEESTQEGTETIITTVITLEEEQFVTTADSHADITETQVVITNAVSSEFPVTPLVYCTLLLVVLAFVIIGLKLFSKTTNENSSKNAKQRDAERITKLKKDKTAKTHKGKSAKKKEVIFKKTVAKTIPYNKCLPDNIWLLGENKYSKVYSIADINYNLGDENQQDNILYNYRAFLNSLDDTEDVQISVINEPIDLEEYKKKMMIPEYNDNFEDLRDEYNERVLLPALSKGNNAIHKKILITVTIKAPDHVSASRKFSTIDLKLKNCFDKVGSTQLKELTNQERLESVKTFFINKEYKLPVFTDEDYKKELEKTYIAPDYFDFSKPDYFMFGDYYCKTVFIKEYPHEAGDNIIKDIIDTNLDIIVTTSLFAYDTAEARKKVQRKISDITSDMGSREQKAVKSGYFNTTMPQKIKNMLDDFRELYDMISVEDQKLFLANTIIMVKAKSYDELKSNMELVNSALKSNGCSYAEMKYQQEEGMCDCLPIGTLRKFYWNRSMPSESIEVLTPFNVKEMQQEKAVYYGCNKLSNNMVSFNRIEGGLINPAGFILGTSGSGKSFYVKREMTDVFLRYPEAEIIVIDPEREYPSVATMLKGQSTKVSTGSKNYINPLDFDFALIDEDDYDVIKEKSQLITSFIACMYTDRGLTPQELSFIDRCVRKTYIKSGVLRSLDINDMPILQDFYDIMQQETENVDPKMKMDMLATLEMYVGDGSANYFNHQTNVNIYNRFVSFDIKELSGVLKTQAMLLVLDNIWNRLSANRAKHIPTWIYVDEIHVLFANPYCLNFIQQLYKRARKYGGIITGITQNIIDILRDDSCVTMLANCEFIALLKQSPSDIIKIKEVLHYSDSELAFVGNVGAGEGLLTLGGADKIPFYDKFPTDTKLYKAMSTSFSETKQIIEENE